jgi:hypothetical protein
MPASTLIVCLIAALSPTADEPSPEALFGRFRDNARSLATLKVQWRRDSARTEEGAAVEAARLAGIEGQLDAMDNSTDEYHRLSQELNRRRQILAATYAPKRMFQTYLTDRSRFMMRGAPPNWDALQHSDDWLMPDVAVTEETMKTKYGGFAIVVHDGRPDSGFRTCMPTGGGVVSAFVRTGMYPDGRNDFPPLALDQALLGPDELRHPIDAFFREVPKDFANVGRAQVAGRSTVVIERRTEAPIPGREARFTRVEIVRAYLDADRGALPLRIEWDVEDRDAGKPIAKPKPVQVLETTEVVPVGGGFYPVKGSLLSYGADPANEDGKVVVVERMTWHAAKVEANVPLDETFAVPIPKGTYYYDEVLGYTVRAGEEAVNHARLPWTLCGILVACWAIYGAVALARAALARRGRQADAKSPGMGEMA